MDGVSLIKRGDLVRVFQKISEGKRERVVPWAGKVLRIKGAGDNMMITIQQTLDGVGVEKIFPIMLPSLVKIEVVEDKKTKQTARRRKAARKSAKK